MSIGNVATHRIGALLLCAAAFISGCTDEKNLIAPNRSHVPGAQIQIVSGNAQEGVVDGLLTRLLIVRVVEADGVTPVPGEVVTWSVIAGGGTLQYASRITAADGTARNRWTLGATPGSQQVDAQSGTATASFNANANTGPFVNEITITPAIAYTGFDTVNVNVKWRAQDAAGVENFLVSLPWASATPQNDGYCSTGGPPQFGTEPQLISGTIYNGVWRCTMRIFMSPSKGLRDLSVYANNASDVADTVVVEDAFTQNDSVAPILSRISFTPGRVYTAQDTAPVTVTWRAIDPAGVGQQYVTLNPTTGFGPTGVCGPGVHPSLGTEPVQVSGTRTDGYWSCTVYLPQDTNFRERWVDVVSKDGAENMSNLRATNTLKENDATGPVFSNIVFTPTRVYTAVDGNSVVTITWRAADPAGIAGQQVRLPYVGDLGAFAPSCGPSASESSTPPVLVTGTIYNGTYQCTITMPQDMAYRQREVTVGGIDFANNAFGSTAPTLLIQNDTTGPLVRDITFTPARIYTAKGEKTVTVTWRATDRVGVAPVAQVSAERLSGGGTDACPSSGPGSAQMTSGTVYDGTWSCTFTSAASIDKGPRTINLSVYDQSANATHIPAPVQLQENDAVSPVISNITFTPTFIGYLATPRTVTVTWSANDPAGIYSTGANFEGYTCNGVLVGTSTTRYRCSFTVGFLSATSPLSAPITINASDGAYNAASAETTTWLTVN